MPMGGLVGLNPSTRHFFMKLTPIKHKVDTLQRATISPKNNCIQHQKNTCLVRELEFHISCFLRVKLGFVLLGLLMHIVLNMTDLFM